MEACGSWAEAAKVSTALNGRIRIIDAETNFDSSKARKTAEVKSLCRCYPAYLSCPKLCRVQC